MTPEQIATVKVSSALGWVYLSNFVNEKQETIEFKDHRFMIQIYDDRAEDVVCIKSAQVGFSVFAILSSLHELKYEKRNILYALPTRNVVNDFVVPKVNPLITSNQAIANEMAGDSVSLKKLGDRFIYFKGGSEREAISVSCDTLIIDEYDKMPDMNIVSMFDSRLQAAKEPRRKRFSNPTSIGFGIDMLYKDSNQYHWFVKCQQCQHDWFIDYEPDEDMRHYVDKERQVFACGKCQSVLTDNDRRNGRWVAKYPKRARHGYWISQMMAPWVTAERIMEQEQEMDTATFYSMVLGKAYTPSDMVVNRETILRACAPSIIQHTGVAMGVDQDAGGQYYVLMTSQGIFDYGYVKSWEEIERIKLTYSAVVVADPAPYPTMPKKMAEKYRDWYICYFKEMQGLGITDWKGSVVYADRTRMFDTIANEITNATLLFRQRPQELEQGMISHWENLYRTTVEEPDGRTKSTWLKKDGKQSDYPFALLYARVALSTILSSSNASLVEPTLSSNAPVTDSLTANGRFHTTLTESVRQTFADFDEL